MTPTPYARKAPATAAESAFLFYDIESLNNAFTVALYRTSEAAAVVYYLIDEDPSIGLTSHAVRNAVADPSGELMTRLYRSNPALLARQRETPGSVPGRIVKFLDLANDSNARSLARLLGGVVDKGDVHLRSECPISRSAIVCDTHPDYDHRLPDHAFVAGYNSNQYDTTMLALYFSLRFDEHYRPHRVTAAQMRAHNNDMFALHKSGDRPSMSRYLSHCGNRRAAQIRSNWLSSGRHLDVARLNELQQKVALKRLLGMLGHQILESERLAGPNARLDSLEDFFELAAYNISDTVGTALLFDDNTYTGSFDLRSGLLRTYPETVFNHNGDYRTPVLDTAQVLTWPRPRLTTDTSSAQFAGRILAPYRDLRAIPGHIADLPVVSYRYPDPLGHNGSNIGAATNVLTATRDFFFETVPADTASGLAAHQAFENIYRYYRRIEGLNFDDAQHKELAPVVITGRISAQLEAAAARESAGGRDVVSTADLSERFLELFGGASSAAGDGPRRFTLGTFAALSKALIAWANTHSSSEIAHKELIADIDRLKIIVLARADAAQPYWPADRPASFSETLIEWRNDRNHATNVSYELASIGKLPCNIPYFDSAGEPTSCFATFSTGGIHGAEADLGAFAVERNASRGRWALFRAALDTAAEQFLQAAHVMEDWTAGGEPLDAKTEVIVRTGTEWVADNAASMPPIVDAAGVNYSGERLAMAAWWFRKKLRIDVVDPSTDQIVTVEWGDMLKSGSKANNPILRDRPKGDRGVELFTARESKEFPLFPAGATHDDNKLDPKYRFTSVADVIHEDFTSYYPLMLVNLAAFTNPDLAEPGQPAPDKYSQIFGDKERYGKLRKDKTLTAAERENFSVLREGTKLILNAASGAADARHDTPILMNNMIITMRIIGQLFSWRIGQAQTFAGGRIVSTNTDGLYSTLDSETNQKVLDQHTAAIGVEIEPESLTLVSKDSNNRVEFLTAEESFEILTDDSRGEPQYRPEEIAGKPWYRVVASAGGGTLACWAGPSPRKALAHPAMVDRLLLEYFKLVAGGYTPEQRPVPYALTGPVSIFESMDTTAVREVLRELHRQLGVRDLLKLYQNLLASSPSAGSYLYAAPYRVDPDSGLVIDATDTAHLTFPGDPRSVTDNDALLREGGTLNRHPKATEVQLLGHFTRVFLVRPDTVDRDMFGDPLVIAAAKARAVSASTWTSREDKGLRPTNPNGVDPIAEHLLTLAGEDSAHQGRTRDLILARHSGVDPSTPMLVFNHTIADHPDTALLEHLLASIDTEAYIAMAASSYEENWRNASR
ncbi:hypothetical protein [Rhodococcoides fascians]|uniref:hypothetical protein n=1 Tax=Rhodococcoides fascians TaxID=1828 RepID=UPI0006898F97|nr:hypothetical protein [Rhodococcus fascians]